MLIAASQNKDHLTAIVSTINQDVILLQKPGMRAKEVDRAELTELAEKISSLI